MSSTSYTAARRNLKDVLDQVCRDHEPMLITRKEGGNVVVLSEEAFSSMAETAYLLQSPANARRLLEAIAEDRRGEPGRPLAEALATLGLSGDVTDAR